MDIPSIDIFTFFMFVIPGFVTVWAFRFFKEDSRSQIGDFEYLAQSSFWGLVMLLIYEISAKIFNKEESIVMLLSNPYTTSIVLSFLGLFFGWFGFIIFKNSWIKKVIKWLKAFNF